MQSTTEPTLQTTPEHPTHVLKVLPFVFFVAVLLTGFVLSLGAGRRALPETLAVKGVLTGEWAGAFETDYNEALPFRQLAIDTWGVLQYALFKEGRRGVLVGADGWLFSDEEFDYHPNEAAARAAKLELARSVAAQLNAAGAELVVAVIPAKARLYGDKLGRYTWPGYSHERYDWFKDELIASDLHAPDLLTPLLEASESAPTFLKTDTHWTPYGATVVATALADYVRENLALALPTADFVTHKVGEGTRAGDLATFIPLGPVKVAALDPEPITLFETEQQTPPTLGLLGSADIPVTLVGTSYSANPAWHFEGALKTALQADVLNVADEGKGPVEPMLAYLESEAFRDTPPQLVIWEFPERYLPVDFEP